MTDSNEEELSPLKRALLEIRQLRTLNADAELRRREPIAIVGMGLRFPGGAVDRQSFWELLDNGVDTISEVPADRWDAEAFHDSDPDAAGKMVTTRGGFLDGVDRFDASFFGISHREAASIDPQQRILLSTTWEALEDANIPADSLFGTNAGVFVGIINSDYLRMLLADIDTIDSYAGSGNALSVAAGRISYVLGAEGPAISYDTACSSSLVSVHAAAQSLRQRECDVALAGGVNLILSPELTINHSQARMMAPDGRCKTFDAAADGYVRSEGCGMIVLKRLSEAEADGDRILAVIRGSAVNQDGRSGGLTAPNGPSQERVIAAALAAADLEPAAVSYVEAHGTGTPLGDPIEIGALRKTLATSRAGDALLQVGSVKTNIGHTEAAAGIAGLIKTVLMLEHGAIPPHLHLDELNPHLTPLTEGISIPTESRPWPRTEQPRVAGVSSFGLSGTNAHVIVGDVPIDVDGATPEAGLVSGSATETEAAQRPRRLLPLSARSDRALAELALSHAEQLDDADDEALTAITAAVALNRSHLERRMVVVGSSGPEMADRLRGFADGQLQPSVIGPAEHGTPTAHVGFLFTGHGSHRVGMGSDLYRTEPVFSEAIDRCADLLGHRPGARLQDILFGDGHRATELLATMRASQPALFSLQYALAELWASWGVRPTIVAGHSVGEYAAAVTAGAMDLEHGLLLVGERGRLLDALPEAGTMVALFTEEDRVVDAIGARSDVGVAAVNGPTSTVISGRDRAVADVIAELGLDDEEIRPLDIPVAAHSPLIDPVLDEFAVTAASVTMRAPQVGLVSSMTGRFADDGFTAADYWRRHLRAPVRFGSVFETLREAGCGVFVEIGPHGTLIAQGRRAWPDGRAVWTSSMARDRDEGEQLMTALAAVHTAGIEVDWETVTATSRSSRPKIDLPLYPWQERSYWAAGNAASTKPTTPRWQSAIDGAERRAGSAPLGLRIDAYPDRWKLIDRIALSAMSNALVTLGLFTEVGERHTIDELTSGGVINADHAPLVGRWLGHLADTGALRREEAAAGVGDSQADGTAHGFRADRPLTSIDIDRLIADDPVDLSGIEPLIDYLGRCARSLVDVVTGVESALATLFPDGGYEVVDYLYHHWDIPAYYNGIVSGALSSLVAGQQGGPVRVLEVGAGTGGTAAHVLPELTGTNVHYHFTDVSDFFLSRARERFARHDTVSYGLLDLEQGPEAQGLQPGSFDAVLASNVLHATADLDRTLEHVRQLLVPGGVLIALEGTTYPRWPDISTALIEGWQRFDDDWRDEVPLIAADTWRRALAANGFSEVATHPAADGVADVLLHHVVMARAPGDEPVGGGAPIDMRTIGTDPAESGSSSEVPAVALPEADELAAKLADALPEERAELLVDVVRMTIAVVLRTPDPGSLQRDLPLLDLGFDSLMAVELRNLLRSTVKLDKKLPATLVYDRPTIRAIADYLDGLLGGAEAERADPTDILPAEVTAPESSFADISEDDVEAALLAKLEEVEQ